MNNEISESFWIGADIIGSVVLLVFILGIIATSTSLFKSFEKREVTEEKIAEAREWNYYEDGTDKPGADVISVVNKYSSLDGITYVYVKCAGNVTFKRKTVNTDVYVPNGTQDGSKISLPPITSSVKPLAEYIDETKYYTTFVKRDGTGAVVGFAAVEK